ncbi:MAG TPA: GntR family transcriptional regulator [Bacillota bacterium]|nr:GntR family transcriptional regulator [Bacillota bacterium]
MNMNHGGWDQSEISPIRDKVFEFIKNAILEGQFKAGERIVERELADRLNISRTPIREALFRLESVGLVKTLPRKGVVVNRMTTEDIIEIFTILSSLESLTARLATQKLNVEQELKLDRLVDRINEALNNEESGNDYSQFHLEIREIIHEAAKSPRLHEILHSLIEYIRAFAYLSQETPERRRKAFEEHREIAKAIRNREVELAENLARIHIENSKKVYLESIGKRKDEEQV